MKTQNTDSVIIKFTDYHQKDFGTLSRITGTIDSKNMIRLLNVANLEANPRKPKHGEITGYIIESLKDTPELFHFKSKGLLIASKKVTELERNRFQLTFEDKEIEGVLDGGHNCLGMGLFLLGLVMDEDQVNRIKLWDDFFAAWQNNCDLLADKEIPPFLVPVEVIFATDELEDTVFINSILDIAQARNNNAELTEETKANKKGHYELIRKYIDPAVANKVEWKTNDGGTIKVRDLVALALIPLSTLQGKIPDVESGLLDNSVIIYSSKSQCVEKYNQIIVKESVSTKRKGDIIEVNNPIVHSALSLMSDFPKIYDTIYERLPGAYNKSSPGFGRIKCVKYYEKDKNKKGDKVLHRPPKTKYYGKDVEYYYPEGFIMPVIYAMRELITVDQSSVRWKTDPIEFINNEIDEILETYSGQIKLADYDPQRVGKESGCYKLVSSAVKFILGGQKYHGA